MCNISPMMNKFMDKQPVKNRQDLKPLDISNIAQETNKESSNELGVCIVLGVFKGMVDGMDDVITCMPALKYDYKSELYSFEWSEEYLLKDKLGSSEKSQSLGDESGKTDRWIIKKRN